MTRWVYRPGVPVAAASEVALKSGGGIAELERMTGVVVADDHPMYRAGVARAIDEAPALTLIGEADDGERALAMIREHEPEVALVDLRMPGLSGTEVCRALTADGAAVRVLLLSAADDPAVVKEALEAGAAGFLSKECTDAEIRDAVTRAAGGETIVSQSLQSGLFAEIAGRGHGAVRLSEGERRTLELAAQGLTNPQIGEALFVSPATVKSYLARAFEKLGVSDRAQAVAEALRRGLID